MDQKKCKFGKSCFRNFSVKIASNVLSTPHNYGGLTQEFLRLDAILAKKLRKQYFQNFHFFWSMLYRPPYSENLMMLDDLGFFVLYLILSWYMHFCAKFWNVSTQFINYQTSAKNQLIYLNILLQYRKTSVRHLLWYSGTFLLSQIIMKLKL